MRTVFRSVVVLSALAAWDPLFAETAPASEAGELERLRGELEALRREYAERLAALERRLSAVEAAPSGALAAGEPAPSAVPAPAPPVEVPPGAAGAGGPSGTLPYYGAAGSSSKIFNPDIAVVGDFLAAAGASSAGGEPSLSFHEAEASFQAVVDPYARGDFFLTFGPDEVGVEEAYVSFPAVPGGLLVKAGKMRTAFGRVDAMHTHQLPWADRPLVTANLLGGEEGLADSGISVARLVPNPWIFLEATGQVYAGGSEVFSASRRRDVTGLGHLRAYHDLTESTNLDLGGSIAYGTNESGPGFHTRLVGADFTFRYRPLRRAIYRQLVARGEAVWSRREQPEGTRSAFGAYVGVDYKLARRWTLGGRFDYSERAEDASLVDKGGSLLLTFWPSEFSQIRAQYRHTRLGEGTRADELLVQLLFSIGAHGAHPF
jgi:hypothetical protein